MKAAGMPVGIEYRLDIDGLADLFAARYDRLVRLAYLMCGDEGLAEELAQEAFVRLWGGRRRVRDPQAAPAYLRRTVLNLSRSWLRRRTLERRHRDHAGHLSTDLPDVPGRVDTLRALQELPARQRACIVLRYWDDLTEAQTAEALGVTVGTVKSQTHKALSKLERLLGGEDDANR